MHGHGHHGKPYEIPDYRIYRVEDAPKLVQVQKLLAQKGLKDPWLRNEVWRYHPGYGNMAKGLLLAMRGFPLGLVAAIITVAVTSFMSDPHHPAEHGDHH